jgi:hypothetical protein
VRAELIQLIGYLAGLDRVGRRRADGTSAEYCVLYLE